MTDAGKGLARFKRAGKKVQLINRTEHAFHPIVKHSVFATIFAALAPLVLFWFGFCPVVRPGGLENSDAAALCHSGKPIGHWYKGDRSSLDAASAATFETNPGYK